VADMYFLGSGPVALAAATPLCVLAWKTATAPRIVVSKIQVYFNGTTATAVPVEAVLANITNTPSNSGGTNAGAIPSNYGPNPLDDAAPASLLNSALIPTGSPATWSTTAPAQGAVRWEAVIPPTSGLPEWVPLGQEVKIGGGKWTGVFLTAQATVSASTAILYME